MAVINRITFFKLRRTAPTSWEIMLFSALFLLSFTLRGTDAVDSCPNCGIADSLLKPCKSALNMDTWPGTLVYQPTQDQASCACNQNYYDQMVGCLKCQSSSSAKYSVKDLAGYQLVCQSYGQTWKQINFPNQTTTISASTTATATSSMAGGGGAVVPTSVDGNPSSGNKSTSGSGNSSLSSGAIAGIVVSVIALIVALSVAGYVWGRRRRDSVRHTDLDEYKYRDTQPDSYMEVALPQYTGMIQPTLPPISKVSNLRVMNPDSDEDEEMIHAGGLHRQQSQQQSQQSFEVRRTSSPGWRRGSFDDD